MFYNLFFDKFYTETPIGYSEAENLHIPEFFRKFEENNGSVPMTGNTYVILSDSEESR